MGLKSFAIIIGMGRQTWPDDRHEIKAGSDDTGAFLESVRALCGSDTASRLQKQYGGGRVYIPSSPRGHQEISRLIGIEAATKIALEIGHGVFEIPLGAESAHAIQLSIVESLCLQEHSAAEIARAAKCSVRNVQYTRARLRRQGRLK